MTDGTADNSTFLGMSSFELTILQGRNGVGVNTGLTDNRIVRNGFFVHFNVLSNWIILYLMRISFILVKLSDQYMEIY